MPTRARWVRAKRSRKTGAIHAASHSDGTSDVNGSSAAPTTSQSQEWYFVSDRFIVVLFLFLLRQASLPMRGLQPTPTTNSIAARRVNPAATRRAAVEVWLADGDWCGNR